MTHKIKTFTIGSFCIALLFTAGCFSSTQKINNHDITTNGFLSQDCYQSIITHQPDRNLKGLVLQRKSARIQAEKKAERMVISNLKSYYLSNLQQPGNDSAAISPQSTAELEKRLESLVKQGYIAYTYYAENNSVVLVYRITVKGIKQKIDSIELSKTAIK